MARSIKEYRDQIRGREEAIDDPNFNNPTRRSMDEVLALLAEAVDELAELRGED